MKRLIVGSLFIMIFTSCAPSIYYQSPDHAAGDCQKTYQECKYEAMKATSSVSSPFVGNQILIDVELRRKAGELVVQCMKIKGYTTIKDPAENACKHE